MWCARGPSLRLKDCLFCGRIMVTEVRTEDGRGGGCGTERGCGCGSESERESLIGGKTSDGSKSGCVSGCGSEHSIGKAECLTIHGIGCGRGCGSDSGSEWGTSRPSASIHRQATMPILGNGPVTRERAGSIHRSHQVALSHPPPVATKTSYRTLYGLGLKNGVQMKSGGQAMRSDGVQVMRSGPVETRRMEAMGSGG